MNLKKNIIYKFIILNLNFTLLFSEGVWVKYGWELYNYVVDAQTASLGNAVIAYNTNSIHSSICLLYTSDAADEEDSVDLGGRRIIK